MPRLKDWVPALARLAGLADLEAMYGTDSAGNSRGIDLETFDAFLATQAELNSAVIDAALDAAPQAFAVHEAFTSRYGYFINPHDPVFGGPDGDDWTDALTAAGAAVAALPGSRGALMLRAGTYNVTSWPFTIGFVSVVGAGEDATIIAMTGSSGFAVDIATSGPHTFTDLSIDGAAATGSAAALRLNGNLTKNMFTRVGFRNFATTTPAVVLDGSSENVFDTCHWRGNSYNLDLSDNPTSVSTANDNAFRSCNLGNTVEPTGVAISLTNVEANTFDACTIQSAANITTVKITNSAGAVGVNSRSNAFINGYWEDNGGGQVGSRGIWIVPGFGKIVGTIIRGNRFFQSFQNKPSRQIDLTDTVGTVIKDNYANLGPPHIIVYNGGGNYRTHIDDSNEFYGEVQISPIMGAVVTHSANQPIADATSTSLTFDTERLDPHNFHDNAVAPQRLTVPIGEDGWYVATADVEVESNAAGYRAATLVLNATTTIAADSRPAVNGASTYISVTSRPIYMVAGDYVDVFVYQTSGGPLNVVKSADFSPEFSLMRVPNGSVIP